MLRLVLLVSLLILGANPAMAVTVYKYTDQNGNVVYTDEPRKGAEVLDVQPVPTIPAIPVPQTQTTTPEAGPFRYNKVLIVSPADQHFFINETDPIVVQVAASPTLRSEDKVQLMFNGAPHGAPVSTTTFTFDGMERGEYRTSAKILDKNGQEVGSSDSITFFVKRNSKLMQKPKPTPQPKKL